jgi:hypothetical protein
MNENAPRNISSQRAPRFNWDLLLQLTAVVLELTMLSGSPLTTAWRVVRLRMEEKASRYGG